MGLDGWFDPDKALFDDITSGLLDTISSPAPKDQKNILLVSSKFKNFSLHVWLDKCYESLWIPLGNIRWCSYQWW